MKIFYLLFFLITYTFTNLDALGNASPVIQKFPKGIKVISVEGTKGKLIITSGSDDVSYELTKEKWSNNCTEKAVHFGPSLNIKIKSDSIFSKDECVVQVKLSVPRNVDLEISHGTMVTDIQGVQGRLIFRSASGDLIAKGQFSHVDVKVASSDVFIEGVQGEATITGASSDIKLSYLQCPKELVKLNLTRASGDVEIFVPKDCHIKSSNKTAAGDSFNEFPDSKNPKIDIQSVSASGDFKIKKI